MMGERNKTFMEKQPYIWAYGFFISLVSPIASLYQLKRLNPQLKLTRAQMFRLPYSILPVQTILKTSQINVSTPIKESFNPWLAFGLIGVLQGGVYGQANIYFSKKLKIGKVYSYKGLFRGTPFAALRDMISQGLPFMMTEEFCSKVLDPIWITKKESSGTLQHEIKHWISITSLSVVSTFLSQGLHNCQIIMQSNQKLSYLGTIQQAFGENGVNIFWRGVEARLGLLLFVNILNEFLIKPAWGKVKI